MYLTRVKCQGFRCLDGIDFSPDPGLNVIRGLNAQGKTSMLEAILFAATSKSHRTNTESELVQRGKDGFSIALEAERAQGSVRLEANWWRGAKRFKINGVAQERVSDILGRVHVVFFSPEDIALVKDSASVRRKFLDMELSQISPAYLAALQEYRQALRQRNELLRHATADEALLDVWDAQLVKHGVVVMRERAGFISELTRYAGQAYREIARGEPFEMRYRCDVEHAESFAERLGASRQTDLRRQQTTHGPHRDDIEFLIAGAPARSHASQGQQKSAALAVKLAEVELIRARSGEYPVLMLDEVLAELDDERAARLFNAIPEEAQTLMTTTDLEDRRALYGKAAKIFEIDGGALRCAGREGQSSGQA